VLTLKELNARNAYCYKKLHVPLDKQGFVFVSGQNRDEPRRSNGDYESNGSGKTKIFELLTHAIHQTTSVGDSKNDLLNKFRPKDFELSLDFDRDGIPYRVEQYRKHSQYKTCLRLTENGTPIHAEGTQAIKQTQQRVEARVGLSLGEWYGFVYLAQNSTHAMVAGTPAEKKRYLSRVFGVDVLDAYDKNLAVFLSGQKDTTNRLSETLDRIEALEKEEREQKAPTKEELASLRDRRTELQDRLDTLSAELAQQAQLHKRESLLPKLSSHGYTLQGWSAEKLAKEASDVKANVDRLQNSVRTEERRAELKAQLPKDAQRPDLPALEKALRKAKSRLQEIKDQRTAYERWKQLQQERTQLSSLDSETLQAVDPDRSYREELSKLDGERAVLRQQLSVLQRLDGKATCEACLSPIDAKHTHASVEEKETRLRKIEGKRSSLQAKEQEQLALRDQAKLYTGWKKRSASAKAVDRVSSSDVSAAESSLEAAEKEHRKAADLMRVWEALDRLPSAPSSSLDDLKRDAKLEEETYDLLREAKAYDWTLKLADVQELTEQQKKLQRKLLKAQDELTTAKLRKEQARTRAEEISDLKRKAEVLQADTHRTEVAEVLRVSLQDVKLARLREATRILTTVLPGYISAFFRGGHIKLHIDESREDKLDLLFEKGGKIINLRSISGGQAKRLSVAIILSFTKLTAQTVNVLVADEPYGGLDPISRGVCFELLRDIAVPTTLLTGHESDVSKQRYDQRWTVVMKDHVSTLHRG